MSMVNRSGRSAISPDVKKYLDALKSIITPGLYVAPVEDSALIDLPCILSQAEHGTLSVRAMAFIRQIEDVVTHHLSNGDRTAVEMLFGMGEWTGVPVRERHHAVAKFRNNRWTWERNYRKEPLTRDLMAVLVALQRATVPSGVTRETETTSIVASLRIPRDENIPKFLHVPDPTAIFVGREQNLVMLGETLDQKNAPMPVSVAIHGLGGVGKTELALQYCHAERSRYRFIWWFTAASRDALLEELTTVALALGLSNTGEDVAIVVGRLRAWLEHEATDWLLVFDNADDPHILHELYPTRGRGALLITSRYADWVIRGIARLHLMPVQKSDSISFLVARTGFPSDDYAEMLVDHVDGLPLALQQAGSFVVRAGWSYRRYVDMLNDRGSDVFALRPPGGNSDYPWTVYNVWLTSIQQATHEVDDASDVLKVLSLMAAERIPREIFAKPPKEFAGGDVLRIEAAIASLATYSVIQVAERFISLHRLTQQVEYDKMPRGAGKNDLADFLRVAACLVVSQMPPDPDDSDCWQTFAELVPHAISLSEHATVQGGKLEELALLECQAAGYLNARGSRLGARALLERASSHLPPGGAGHSLRAQVDLGLARVLRNLGDLASALRTARRAVTTIERDDTIDEAVVAACYNILGRIQLDQGSRDDAETAFRSALDIVMASSYGDSRHAISCLNNLGRLLLRQGKPQEAEVLLMKALSVLPDPFETHADVAWTLDNLAMTRFSLGKAREAEELLVNALQIEAQVHGSDHPRTAWSLRNYAHVLMSLGRLDEAQIALERSISIIQAATPDNLGELNATACLLRNVAAAQRDEPLARKMSNIIGQLESR